MSIIESVNTLQFDLEGFSSVGDRVPGMTFPWVMGCRAAIVSRLIVDNKEIAGYWSPIEARQEDQALVIGFIKVFPVKGMLLDGWIPYFKFYPYLKEEAAAGEFVDVHTVDGYPHLYKVLRLEQSVLTCKDLAEVAMILDPVYGLCAKLRYSLSSSSNPEGLSSDVLEQMKYLCEDYADL